MPSSDSSPVRGCVCFDKTFAQMKWAGFSSSEEIATAWGCGTECGLCKPYIQKMLKTGHTEFQVLSEQDD